MFTNKNLIKLALRHTLVAFGAVIVSVATIWFLVGKIDSTASSIIKNRQIASNFDQQTELLSKLKQNAAIIGKNDVLIENAFLSSDNILDFISGLDGIATKNKIIQTFSFDSPAPSPVSSSFPLSSISYTTKMITDVSTFKSYLSDFEKLPYFSKVDSILMSSQDKNGWEHSTAISFGATLFTKTVQ
ncbi:MAG: hypothetical protein PHS95_00130 [Candidatus Pacebacteria bacterium]|nr:hypothetical protein [Candidatus Paceibacterota bacterium]